jgi:hypothetical protein
MWRTTISFTRSRRGSGQPAPAASTQPTSPPASSKSVRCDDAPGLDLGDREDVMADRDPAARHRLRQARLTVVDAVADGRLGDEAADPVLGAHDPGAGELLERPPDGEPVDAVALGEPRLGLQPLARRQLRPVNAGDEVLGYIGPSADSSRWYASRTSASSCNRSDSS